MPVIILLYDVLYTWHVFIIPSAAAAAAAAAHYVAATVRHRAPDEKYSCWYVEPNSIQCFLSLHSNTIHFLRYVPLGSTLGLRPRFAYTTSSVVTGMRGAKAGVSPSWRSSLSKYQAYV